MIGVAVATVLAGSPAEVMPAKLGAILGTIVFGVGFVLTTIGRSDPASPTRPDTRSRGTNNTSAGTPPQPLPAHSDSRRHERDRRRMLGVDDLRTALLTAQGGSMADDRKMLVVQRRQDHEDIPSVPPELLRRACLRPGVGRDPDWLIERAWCASLSELVTPENGQGATVDVDWIVAHLDDPGVRLVEIDVSRAAYDEGHIPGAVLWNAYADLRGPNYKPVGLAELGRLLARSGITPETCLVTYGYSAPLGFWLLRAHGHGDVRMLMGPRDQWAQMGHAWSTDSPAVADSGYPPVVANDDLLASREAVQRAIDDSSQLVLDVRAEGEYAGELFWPSGATADVGRAGHVPGAVSVPIGLLRTEDGTLRSADELRAVFDRAGVGKDKALITYCTIGNRAAEAWFALKYLLGYPDVRVYYGSWVEWGKATDTPIET